MDIDRIISDDQIHDALAMADLRDALAFEQVSVLPEQIDRYGECMAIYDTAYQERHQVEGILFAAAQIHNSAFEPGARPGYRYSWHLEERQLADGKSVPLVHQVGLFVGPDGLITNTTSNPVTVTSSVPTRTLHGNKNDNRASLNGSMTGWYLYLTGSVQDVVPAAPHEDSIHMPGFDEISGQVVESLTLAARTQVLAAEAGGFMTACATEVPSADKSTDASSHIFGIERGHDKTPDGALAAFLEDRPQSDDQALQILLSGFTTNNLENFRAYLAGAKTYTLVSLADTINTHQVRPRITWLQQNAGRVQSELAAATHRTVIFGFYNAFMAEMATMPAKTAEVRRLAESLTKMRCINDCAPSTIL